MPDIIFSRLKINTKVCLLIIIFGIYSVLSLQCRVEQCPKEECQQLVDNCVQLLKSTDDTLTIEMIGFQIRKFDINFIVTQQVIERNLQLKYLYIQANNILKDIKGLQQAISKLQLKVLKLDFKSNFWMEYQLDMLQNSQETIQEIYLDFNLVNGILLFQDFKNYAKLKKLYMDFSKNQIKNEVIINFTGCLSLQEVYINLQVTNIDSFQCDFDRKELSNLKVLSINLSRTNIINFTPLFSSFQDLPKLTSFSLDIQNQLWGKDFVKPTEQETENLKFIFRGLDQLETLNLNFVGEEFFFGRISEALRNLPQSVSDLSVIFSENQYKFSSNTQIQNLNGLFQNLISLEKFAFECNIKFPVNDGEYFAASIPLNPSLNKIKVVFQGNMNSFTLKQEQLDLISQMKVYEIYIDLSDNPITSLEGVGKILQALHYIKELTLIIQETNISSLKPLENALQNSYGLEKLQLDISHDIEGAIQNEEIIIPMNGLLYMIDDSRLSNININIVSLTYDPSQYSCQAIYNFQLYKQIIFKENKCKQVYFFNPFPSPCLDPQELQGSCTQCLGNLQVPDCVRCSEGLELKFIQKMGKEEKMKNLPFCEKQITENHDQNQIKSIMGQSQSIHQ